jgi:hypothetical protein
MKYLKKYRKDNSSMEFCNWLGEKTNYKVDMDTLLKINDMFDLTNTHFNIKKFEKIKIANCAIQRKELNDILRRDGFIFPVT